MFSLSEIRSRLVSVQAELAKWKIEEARLLAMERELCEREELHDSLKDLNRDSRLLEQKSVQKKYHDTIEDEIMNFENGKYHDSLQNNLFNNYEQEKKNDDESFHANESCNFVPEKMWKNDQKKLSSQKMQQSLHSSLVNNNNMQLNVSILKAAPNLSWSSNSFPWSAELDHNLSSIFKISSWRLNQREVSNATLSNKDCFVIMPTGGGKSLLYQLPATLSSSAGKITLVISPLLALSKDQIRNVSNFGLRAEMISGTTTKEKYKEIMDACVLASFFYFT